MNKSQFKEEQPEEETLLSPVRKSNNFLLSSGSDKKILSENKQSLFSPLSQSSIFNQSNLEA